VDHDGHLRSIMADCCGASSPGLSLRKGRKTSLLVVMNISFQCLYLASSVYVFVVVTLLLEAIL